MIHFEKITYEQYAQDIKSDDQMMATSDDALKSEYSEIPLPARATKHSAGYDFVAPREVVIYPGESIKVYTGIKAIMPNSTFLSVHIRSGLGIKFGIRLANCTGIIDSDYANADNEGHIIIKLVNDGRRRVTIPKGKAFAQGIFQLYLITDDDKAIGERTGGIGSTDKT